MYKLLLLLLKNNVQLHTKLQAMLCDKYLNHFNHVIGILLFETAGNAVKSITLLECGPMPNVMVALPNIGDALCSTPQSLADAHY